MPTDEAGTSGSRWNTERNLLSPKPNKNPTADFDSIENQIRVNIDKFKPQRDAEH